VIKLKAACEVRFVLTANRLGGEWALRGVTVGGDNRKCVVLGKGMKWVGEGTAVGGVKLRKLTISFVMSVCLPVMSVCLSVCPHETTVLPLIGFSLHDI
jgi:hypothetical protein